MLRKIKPRLSEHEYKMLYPSGSSPGKFYDTAEIHKVPGNGNIEQLPIRRIVSNLKIKNTRPFMEMIKHKKVPEGFQMVSFDVN